MKIIKKIAFILLLVFCASTLIKSFLDYRNKISFYEDYRQKYEKEKEINNSLKAQVIKNKDLNQIEKTIRDNLNLSKNNEVIIIIPSPTPVINQITPASLPNWKQWIRVFVKAEI